MNTISNVTDGERLIAFLIIQGKAYSSDVDHQECLCDYYQDIGMDSGFDFASADEEELEKIQKILTQRTSDMKDSYDVYGFDLFDFDGDYLLLANDQKTFEDNKAWAEQYAKENEVLLGYFISHDDAVIVF